MPKDTLQKEKTRFQVEKDICYTHTRQWTGP